MEITNLNTYTILSILVAFFSVSILLWSSITFIIEKELKAAFRAILLTLFVPAIFLLPLLFTYPGESVLAWIVLIFPCFILIVIIFPVNLLSAHVDPIPSEKHDERDVMFSRGELIEGTDRFRKYYESHQENRKTDDIFRKNPGLLSKHASYYHPWFFNSANTNFKLVSKFHDICDGDIETEKSEYVPEDLKNYIKKWARQSGAFSVGITQLKDYHLYSYGGRAHNYGKKTINNHKYAIALTVEMDYSMMATAPKSPVISESAYQYLRSGTIAVQIASFIRDMGYSARAHIDAHFELICPLVARDAGLGEIGRMGLLMTPEIGPRNRIAVITTDLELPVDERKADYSMIDFCNVCKKCNVNCPVQAIPSTNRDNINGVSRWKINSEACYTYWTKVGTDCGKCMMVCPYSHPDYLFHRIIRYFIRRSFLFRRFAVLMDDFFYGKKPASK